MNEEKLVELINEILKDGDTYTTTQLKNEINKRAVSKLVGEVSLTNVFLLEFLVNLSLKGIVKHGKTTKEINLFSK